LNFNKTNSQAVFNQLGKFLEEIREKVAMAEVLESGDDCIAFNEEVRETETETE
jgi:hypothetical protein